MSSEAPVQEQASDPILLRAHHGMCLCFFHGHGYSAGFIANMTRVLHTLRDSDPKIRVTASADILCEKCPHNHDGICDTEEKVSAYDRAVLSRCGLSPDTVMNYSEYHSLVSGKILSEELRETLCGNCQWSPYCH